MDRGTPGCLRLIRRVAGMARVSGLTDRQLLEDFARSRSEEAFALLVQRHAAFVLGLCRRVLQHEQDAEDVFQATFLVLARKADCLRWHDSITNWLHGVAYRLALKARAANLHRQALERHAGEKPPQPAPAVTWQELQPVLDEELQRLPAKYRMPLLLCYLESKTRDEAAQELGWTTGAVKGRLERGRNLLRQRLARRGVTLPAALLATALGGQSCEAAAATPLATATAEAAVRFSAGQALTGLVSAQALALARGALQAALVVKLRIVAAVLLLAGVAGGGGGLLAYRALAGNPAEAAADLTPGPAPVRAAPPVVSAPGGSRKGEASAQAERPRGKDVEGIVKDVDPAHSTIRVTPRGDSGSGVRVFRWAGRDVTITTDTGRTAQPGELREGLNVTLTLSPDEQYVVSIRAEAPVLKGRARAVNAFKRTVSLSRRGRRDVTLRVAGDARVVLNGKECKLADLTGGVRVKLTLALDRSRVVALDAEGGGQQDDGRRPKPRRRFGRAF
jgi:RNA polymerase sigma factor (sigma-70 family)